MQFIDLGAQQARIRPQLDAAIKRVLDQGAYIMGPEVKAFEKGLSDFCGARFSLGCANGTDALQLAVMALGAKAGDAIFCPTFTFAATAEIVPMTGATPYFVDVDRETYNLDIESLKRGISDARARGLRPAGVIPVDLFGLPADYDSIEAVARENGMWIIADSAQGFGATYKGRRTGSIGDIATTSFFPAKPLGCYGDGGAIFTGDEKLASITDSLRVHGKGTHKYDNERIGVNSRLDTLQAAILLEKLAIYEDEIERRQAVAQRYSDALGDCLVVPVVADGLRSVWAQYTVRPKSGSNREAIMADLKERGIPTMVYYPRPLHRQTAYRHFPGDPAGLAVAEGLSTEVFSLPMHPYLEPAEQDRVIDAVKAAASISA